MSMLYSFKNVQDGHAPAGGLLFDKRGALYGVTLGVGNQNDFGTIFKLNPPAKPVAEWTKTIIYRFKGGEDGWDPNPDLILDQNGALYGTTL